MVQILGPLVGDIVLVYLDNGMIFAASVNVLLETLKQVLVLLVGVGTSRES